MVTVMVFGYNLLYYSSGFLFQRPQFLPFKLNPYRDSTGQDLP